MPPSTGPRSLAPQPHRDDSARMSTRRTALRFLGGAGTVTGSKTLVEGAAGDLLVDCGLFQGERELRRRNWKPLDVDLDRLRAVLLTHAHLDHCGHVPRLCADGFRGPVLCTATTEELVRIVLLDSAHLLEEEARQAARHGWSRHAHPRPLYDTADAQRAIAQLRGVEVRKPVDVLPGVVATWRPAGHILGSSTVHVETPDCRVLFTGDLGRDTHPLLLPPDPPAECDALVVESTYGSRRHPPSDPGLLAETIRRTVLRGGSVLVPAFAVDRTEMVLCALRDLLAAGEIPQVPVFVDSPMALQALKAYRAALERQDPDVRVRPGVDPFALPGVQALRTPAESRTVNVPAYPSIVVSASGMATGGRVLHHLAAQLPDPRNTVLLVGHQVVGTRGRALLDGARSVKLHGRYVPVRAEVVEVPGLSAHADADEVLAWLGRSPAAPRDCFVVHGEPRSSAALAERITAELGWHAVVPRADERVVVGA